MPVDTIPDWATAEDQAPSAADVPDWATPIVPDWAQPQPLTGDEMQALTERSQREQQQRADYGRGQEPGTELTNALFNQLPQDLSTLARAIPADVASNFIGPEYGGNLLAAINREPLPVDAGLAEAAKESPGWATTAKISQGLASTAPLLITGTLPAAAQKLVLAGFTAKMISDAPHIATELGAELGKPKDQQNPDTISTLWSDAVQVVAFSALGGAHLGKAGGTAWNKFATERNLPQIPEDWMRERQPVSEMLREIGYGVRTADRMTDATPDWARPDVATPPVLSPTPETTPTPTDTATPSREANITPAASQPGAGNSLTKGGETYGQEEIQGRQTLLTQPTNLPSPEGTSPTTENVPAAAVAPAPAQSGVKISARHLTEAESILRSAERPPDILDVIAANTGASTRVKFPAADFADTLNTVRDAIATTRYQKPYAELRKEQRRQVDNEHRLSLEEGQPADEVLQGLAAENPKFANWTPDDLAQAMSRAAEGRNAQLPAGRVQALAEDIARAERTKALNDPWASAFEGVTGNEPELQGSGMAASKSPGVTGFPVLLGGVDAVRPMETPEMLRLFRDVGGEPVTVKKLNDHLRGYAKGAGITLNEKLFADPQQVALTLAHEIGHAGVDWFPEGTLKRGNLIGRLISSPTQFLQQHLGWLNDKKLRGELVALSAYWRPWDRTKATKAFIKYRDSGKELYADAVSVLLNSPGLLEQKAPNFYHAFFSNLNKKPRFKQEFFALQDILMRGPEAVLGERLAQSREGFEKGEAMLHEKLRLRDAARNSFKDFLTKVRIQSLDIADFVKRRLGSKDPRQATEFDRLYEEWKLDDNKNAADVSRIYHDMIQPIVKVGLDEHTFGQVLELQRIAGGVDAYQNMQAMRKALGPDRMTLLQQASDTLAQLERKGMAVQQAGAQVAGPLAAAGIPFDYIDIYRQLKASQGTRAELANAQGRSPTMAQAELDQLFRGLTPEQRTALEQSAQKFRELIYERATEARDVGIINKLTFEQTVTPNRETYAAFRPLDKIETYVSPTVRRARGALSDIENPFITTLLKLQSLNNLIETQRVKNVVRDQMTTLFPADFVKADTVWNGRAMEAVRAKPDQGRVKIMEDGKVVEYNTDPYIAKMFDRLTPSDSFWLNKILEVPFRMGIYPLIIKYNPGFLLAFNPRRDMARTIRNLYAVEGVTRRELLPNYASPEIWKAVNDYLAGRPNPLAAAMIKNKAITTSWQGFSRIDQADVMTDLLRRYKLAGEPIRNQALRTLMFLPDKLNQMGSFLEALPKFASYKTLLERGIGPERASFLVRNYAGTPNFKLKGEFAAVQNSYVPFINIFLQGWRSDLKLATSPKTAGGWWFQWALQHGWQATFVGLAVAGVFGPDIKKLYAGISEYDRTNYGTLPLGERTGEGEFGHKTVYARFPRDETSRLFSAITYKATRAIADKAMGNAPHPDGLPTEILAFGAGVTPSPTPILNVAAAWKEYLSGRNPTDPFRNKPVITDRDFKAGGLPAAGDMAVWTLGQSGVLNLFQWNPKAETTTELTVSATPIVNRLLKISDQGHREDQMNSERLDAQAKAQLRIQYNDAATSIIAKHAWLQSLGDKRTPEQTLLYGRLHAWKTQAYDPVDEAAWLLRTDKPTQLKLIGELNAAAEQLQKSLKKP